jgi:predicted ATPase/transcriptional regulator with XRE-family HTH domain
MRDEAQHLSSTPTFAETLRRYRIAAALSQEALARRAGLSARAISDLERGVKTRPYLETIRLLADALELSPADRAALTMAARPEPVPARTIIPMIEQPNLPSPPTPLIGREEDIDRVSALIGRDDVRFVTLVGPGGVGKTRLALAVAEQLQSKFAAGVVFVPLASLDEPEMVTLTLAQCLGLRNEQPEMLLDRLAAFLQDKRLLLVVDNVEHVLPAMAQLVDLVRRSGCAKLLVTSRAVLHLSGEHLHMVKPLPVANAAAAAREIGQSPAVRLFVSRAAAVRPTFMLTEENAPTVAAICERLDGLPLAIELAAARVKLFSPSGLLDRLDAQPALLATTMHDVAPRHRSFREAVAWSHALLSGNEQRMFRRLSVFRGGWTIEAAEQVANLDDLSHSLETLIALVDQSLVQPTLEDSPEPRFRMLATVREFAAERLSESGEEVFVRNRHSLFFTELAEAAERSFWGPGEIAWLHRADSELENFRAAIRWSAGGHGDPEHAMRLASAIWWMWQTRFGHAEGRAWLEHSIAQGRDVSITVKAQTLATAGMIACFQGDYSMAERWLRDALALAREAGDTRTIAWSTLWLGGTSIFQGEFATSLPLISEGYRLFESIGDAPWTAYSSFYLGVYFALTHDAEQSAAHFSDALRRFREIGFASGIAATLGNMGAFELKLGDRRKAEPRLREALSMRFPLKDRWGLAQELRELAQVAALDRDAVRGVRLYAASEALLDSLQTQPPTSFMAYWSENEAWLKAQSEDPAYAESWRTGYTQPVETAMAEVRALAVSSVDSIDYLGWPEPGESIDPTMSR